jgi:hypothetical protein
MDAPADSAVLTRGSASGDMSTERSAKLPSPSVTATLAKTTTNRFFK